MCGAHPFRRELVDHRVPAHRADLERVLDDAILALRTLVKGYRTHVVRLDTFNHLAHALRDLERNGQLAAKACLEKRVGETAELVRHAHLF